MIQKRLIKSFNKAINPMTITKTKSSFLRRVRNIDVIIKLVMMRKKVIPGTARTTAMFR
jgi:hypothetical protein